MEVDLQAYGVMREDARAGGVLRLEVLRDACGIAKVHAGRGVMDRGEGVEERPGITRNARR